MTIQFNTDHNITNTEAHRAHFTNLLADELDRYSTHITHVDAHLTDENGGKEGNNDKRCVLETRIKGMPPMAVTNHANTEQQAVSGAINKLKSTLDTAIGRLKNHQN